MTNSRKILNTGVLVVVFLMAGVFWLGTGEVRAATCDESVVRWSASSNRIYITGADAVCTIPELDVIVDHAQIEPVNAEGTIWWLGSNIVLQNGATLDISGPATKELRLKSNNTGAVGEDYVYLRAHWGNIIINNTKITSWDEAANGPDKEYDVNRRAFIQARSFLDGGVARESRMDIKSSDVGYLGYHGAEAYGLSWKVLGRQEGIFDKVNVYGDIRDSHIHNNYFGVYTYGLDGGQWISNIVNNNVVYGFDPHDDSDNILIANNNVYNNGSHGIIASQRCNNLVIRGNYSHDNGGNGIMLHRDTNDSEVYGNKLTGNGDSGIALFESHRNKVYDNKAVGNGKGIRLSVGSRDNEIKNNVFDRSVKYGIYFYQGSDLPVTGDGRPRGNVFMGNKVTNSKNSGMKLKEGDKNIFVGNIFIGNSKDLMLDNANGNIFKENKVAGNRYYGVRLKNGSRDNVIKANKIYKNGKVGIYVMAGSRNNEISENEIYGHWQYGVKIYQSSRNRVLDNKLRDNRYGIGLNGAFLNYVEGNEITKSRRYGVYVQRARNNTFANNVLNNNGRNYYYAKYESDNTILVGTGGVLVKARRDGSQWKIVSEGGLIYRNSEELPQDVERDRTWLLVEGKVEDGIVKIETLDWRMAATNRVQIMVDRHIVENEGQYVDGWKIRNVSGQKSVTMYEIGGYLPDKTIVVRRDGEIVAVVSSGSDGKAVFKDTLSGNSEGWMEYKVTQHRKRPARGR